MTEPPSAGPQGPGYDDRRVHAARDPRRPGTPPPHHGPPPEGPPPLISRAGRQALLATGAAALVLGVLVLLWPGPSLLAAGVLFGVYLLVSGVLQLVSAFATHRTAPLRVLAFASGALSILLGLFCFRGALQSVLLLALWIGIGWLIRGLTQTIAAVHDPGTPARGWQIFFGVLAFLAGAVLIVSPLESVVVLTVVAGWWLVVVGIVETVIALRVRGHAEQFPSTV
ncbi:HdeD family acid-resistance protein [Streptomyces thermoalcalitolerans]|uniref:HdeD family acid-resistance protein n=1 Tax=Streptomyces thermoalcalitolerans TaxID=65605 RepID=A0ABN1PLP8_9ACTN